MFRNPGIDALRGTSIVLVIMHHIAIRIPLTHTALAAYVPHRILSGLCWNGYESVFVFFVISGFLITETATKSWGHLGHPHFRAFYLRRAARILPCLLALVSLLSILDLLKLPDYTIIRPDQSLPGAIFAAITFHLNWYEAFSGYLPGNWDVLWSLSIEEAFYIAFPLACLLARRGPAPLVLLLLALALSLPVTHAALENRELLQEKAYLPGMAAIAAGILAAIASRRWRTPPRLAKSLIVAGLAAWICVLFFEDLLWPHLKDSTLLLLTAGTAALLIGLQAGQGAPLPLTGWLRAFGRLSYEIYLTHMFIVFTALRLWHAAALPDRLAWLLYPTALALSFGLGWCVARLLSTPADTLIRRRWLPPPPGKRPAEATQLP